MAAPSRQAPISNPPAKGGLAGLFERRFALIAGAVAAVAALVPFTWLLADRSAPVSPPARVETALEALVEGDMPQARLLAERFLQRRDLTDDQRAVVHYVLGVAKARAADDSAPRDHRRLRAVAVAHLRICRELGFPHGHEADGLFYLGKNLLLTGYAAESRSPLARSLALEDPRQAELLSLLARSHMVGADARFDEAAKWWDQLLSLSELPRELRDEALVGRSEVDLAQGDLGQSAARLAQIADDSPLQAEAKVLRGRVMMAEARAAADRPADADKLRAAIEVFRAAQGHDSPARLTSAKSSYLIAAAFIELGETRAAVSQLQRTCAGYPGTPEAVACEAELARLAEREGRAGEALDAYRRVVAAATPIEAFANPWLPPDELAARLQAAIRRWIDARDFANAIALAEAAHPALPKARATELEAEGLRRWGQHTIEIAAERPRAERERLESDGRRRLRQAGAAYERLAKLNFEARRYPLDLWAGADCYFEGRNYTRALELLRQYRRHETRRGQAATLRRMGESYLALGQFETAVKILEECISNYRKDTETYRARYVEAQARLELGQSAEAERLLLDNLTSDTLAPASREWRETLLALARLLAAQGRDAEAVEKLEEWVERYPRAEGIHEANYLLGQALRRQAAGFLREADAAKVASARNFKRREADLRRQRALTAYGAVLDSLLPVADSDLSPAEVGLLRNSLFARAATLGDLDRWAEAAALYSQAGHRYQRRPEALVAFVELAAAKRRMSEPDQARTTLAQARIAVDRLPADAVFTQVTNYDRAGWTLLLGWLQTL